MVIYSLGQKASVIKRVCVYRRPKCAFASFGDDGTRVKSVEEEAKCPEA